MACQIKVREKRDKRDKPFLMSRLADSLLDWAWPVTIQPEAGGVVLSKLSKLLNQENALSAPSLRTFAITVAR
jgi:hypothetical protein